MAFSIPTQIAVAERVDRAALLPLPRDRFPSIQKARRMVGATGISASTARFTRHGLNVSDRDSGYAEIRESCGSSAISGKRSRCTASASRGDSGPTRITRRDFPQKATDDGR